MQKPDKKINRRRFFKRSSLVAVGGAVALGGISVPLLRSDELLLRPPGALTEDLFLASCIKCGQCLQVCPPQVIELAGISAGFGIGTPYIFPRQGGCILCSGLPCVLACPTGALDHDLSLGKDAEMGLAVISGPATCLSVRGINDLVYRIEKLETNRFSAMQIKELDDIMVSLIDRLAPQEKALWEYKFKIDQVNKENITTIMRQMDEINYKWLTVFTRNSVQAKTPCQICLDECPIKQERTIEFVTRKEEQTGHEYLWPEVQKTCVGCGVCEEKCPTPTASITITPRLKWSENR